MDIVHVCTGYKIIGISAENKIWPPNKEYISGH